MEIINKKSMPCRECPYLKTSAPGYFGPNDPNIYWEGIVKEFPVPCHMTMSKRETVCTGSIAARKNSFKSSRNPMLRHCESVVSDKARESCLNARTFREHHKM